MQFESPWYTAKESRKAANDKQSKVSKRERKRERHAEKESSRGGVVPRVVCCWQYENWGERGDPTRSVPRIGASR